MSHKDRRQFLRQRLLALRMVGAVALLAPSASLRAANKDRAVKVGDSISDSMTEDGDSRDTARRARSLSTMAARVIGDDTEEAANGDASLSRFIDTDDTDDTAPLGHRETDGLLTTVERNRLARECPSAKPQPERTAPVIPVDVFGARHVPLIVESETLLDRAFDAEARAQGWRDYLAEYPAGEDAGRDASLCSMMGIED